MIYFLTVICIILFICVVIKIVLQLTSRHNGSFTCLVGKTTIVTGSNTGIGYYTALDFAKRGAKVILACRNKDRAEEARRKIIDSTNNSKVFVELIDFASLKSVRDFAKRIKQNENRLDILVNNAGVMLFENITTEDGLSMSMQVNYFGPFLLTVLLTDLMKKTGSSRIVNVGSLTAFWATIKPNNLNYFNTSLMSKIRFENYANSKLYILLWTNELARRLKGTSVTANSLNPGEVYTDILRNNNVFVLTLYNVAKLFFLKTPEEGAETTTYVAVSKDIQNISGQYFHNCKISNPPKLALDAALAKKIWEDSENLVNLTSNERTL